MKIEKTNNINKATIAVEETFVVNGIEKCFFVKLGKNQFLKFTEGDAIPTLTSGHEYFKLSDCPTLITIKKIEIEEDE